MTRRAGQIQKRGDRKWLVRVFAGRDGRGRRTYRSKTVHGTKKDADRELREMQGRRDRGVLGAPTRMTLDEYLDRWLEAAAKPRIGPRTFEDYQYLLGRHVRPVLGGRRLEALTPLDLQGLYEGMQERGLSGRTVHVTHNVLRSALRQAVRWRILPMNPASDVDLPRWERREMRALTSEEAARFRAAAAEHPMGLLFMVLLATGMRPGEALGLRWQDVDLRGCRVRIRQTLVRLRGPRGEDEEAPRWCFRPPKTAKSRREVPIPASLAAQLAEHRRAQAKERLRRGPHWQDLDLVFPGRLGQPLDWHNVSQRPFKAILQAAELPAAIRPYDLRHSTASLLLAAGEHVKVVAERLGHSTTTLTLDTYSHVAPGMQERATERLEGILYGDG